jgi:hypothetical protein
MKSLDKQALQDFADAQIIDSHDRHLMRLENIKLKEILRRKNPYLFRARNFVLVADLIRSLMETYLSASEEEQLEQFLKHLAIFVSERTCNGKKSSAEGIDLEFDEGGFRYLVSIKSGLNWGNSSQHKRLEQNFKNALKVQKQAKPALHIQAVLGACYGRTATTDKGLYRLIAGQSFWHFLSGDPYLYIDIIEPIGHQAKQHNDAFWDKRAALENRLITEFTAEFCDVDYRIDWPRLVQFNSGNLKRVFE